MIRFLVSMALIALAVSCSRPVSKGAEPDSKLVRYLPPDPTMLAGVHVQALVSSALYKRHEAELNVARLDAFSLNVGVDPRKDVRQALLTWSNNQTVALVDGRFDQLKAGNGLVFPKPDVLAAGPKSFLSSIASNHTEIPAAMRERLDSVPKGDQIWIVSTQGLPLDRVPVARDVRSALANIAGNIRAFSIGFGADEGAHLHAELICDSDAGAKRVHDALRGAIGMGRLTTRDDQLDTLKLYDELKVDQDHSIVRVHADLDAKEADAAITLLSHVRAR